jgi:two-component system, response regulator / RNA-binding antiterminator
MTSSTRVLLVDSRPERAEVLRPVLRDEGLDVIACIAPNQDLLAAIRRHCPDLILIDIDSPDRDTLESLRNAHAHQPRPMVMFTQDDDGATIRRAVEAGVTAYIVDGLETRRVRPIVDAAMAQFAHYRAIEEELQRAQEKLTERKIIERAKGIVMQQQGVSEPQAFTAMRTLAMRKNKKLVEIAEGVIAAAELMQR